jgi:hypothetical protein
VVEPGRLPGRQRRQLTDAGRAHAARTGQGPNCFDFNLSRVVRVKSRAWLRRSLSKFLYSSVQHLRKFLEIRRKIRKIPNQLLLFAHSWILNSCSMTNTNVKNLDLQYLKNHKSSKANFWICCVLGHD